MKVAVLTSSRADYGIYRPLLKKLFSDPFFKTELLVFGTHLSTGYGITLQEIMEDEFPNIMQIETPVLGDSPEAIATSMAATSGKFAGLWAEKKAGSDLVFCLGDRFEMFAAVSASIPFSIPVAHIHGGETTLGAIDNVFRDSLTCMSSWHFTSAAEHAQQVKAIKGTSDFVYNVGALSLDNLSGIKLLSLTEFKAKFNIDLSVPTILITFHPETVAFEKNRQFVQELVATLQSVDSQLLITMPNTDTGNLVVRQALADFADSNPKAICVESLGTQGYFSAMANCSFVLGNSSSGIIEAASFKKYVINIGDRQKGRTAGENVLHCRIEKDSILQAIQQIPNLSPLSGSNLYGNGNAAEKIVQALKSDWGRFKNSKQA